MYSVVVISATLPFQLSVALMPNRLCDGEPSACLISLRPQPVSWPAWPIMKLAGMPDSRATVAAASLCCSTKPAWRGPAFTRPTVLVSPVAERAPLPLPRVASVLVIWRPSWRSMASDRPPGRPESCTENCWSSRSIPRLLPSPSIRPDFCVASRMLLMSSRMKSDSNCLAASFSAALSSPLPEP